jgi:hypothetical protein
MVKHVSSAWDPDYYNYLAFLCARELITVDFQEKFEIAITPLGEQTIERFESPEVARMIRRCKLLKLQFSALKDSQVSEIINKYFRFTVL